MKILSKTEYKNFVEIQSGPLIAGVSSACRQQKVRVPLMRPRLPTTTELIPYLNQIDANQFYSNFGPLNALLQRRIESLCALQRGQRCHVVTASSGTSALEALIQSLNLRPGAKIAVPALTFVATASSIVRMGFEAVACDVDPHSWLMTPESLSHAKLDGVEAVIPVATFGIPQDTSAWSRWADATGRKVIIDAAAAFGGQLPAHNVPIVFSMHATKPLSSAEGGLVMTCDPEQGETVRRLTNFGLPSIDKGAGTNAKLSEYHAAVGLASLDKWSETVESRRQAFEIYRERAIQSGIDLLPSLQRAYCPSVIIAKFPCARTKLQFEQQCLTRGVETRRWYTPTLAEHPALAGRVVAGDALKHANRAANQLLGLPFYTDITRAEIHHALPEYNASAN